MRRGRGSFAVSSSRVNSCVNSFCENPIITNVKNLTVLFAGNENSHQSDALFDGKSAFSRAVSWAESIDEIGEIETASGRREKMENAVVVFCSSRTKSFVESETQGKNIRIAENAEWTIHSLLASMAAQASAAGADTVLFAFADCPFLNTSLTAEIVETHKKYAAEYTFADGYPEGFAPEAIDAGALSLLASLSAADALQKEVGAKKVSRDAIFSVMKGDINAFEIETVIAPRDFRQYRLRFACDSKANASVCASLFASSDFCDDPVLLSQRAVQNPRILHSLPAFYRVGLTEAMDSDDVFALYPNVYKKMHGVFPREDKNAREMPFDRFQKLIGDIASFSETAVVALSAGGEPLKYSAFEKAVETVLQYAGLSVLIETSGYAVTEELAQSISRIAENAPKRAGEWAAVMWIVSVDAADAAMYAKMHLNAPENAFERAKNAVGILAKHFGKNVYPQFLRVNENEEQLEAFFRFWKRGESPSLGNVLVQKYDYGCAFLRENKPADLSPLERFPCWHVRRDFTVLSGGEVPICPEWLSESDFVGNAFEQNIGDLWEKSVPLLEAHVKKCYSEKCSACDEFYTFNF